MTGTRLVLVHKWGMQAAWWCSVALYICVLAALVWLVICSVTGVIPPG